MAQRTLRRALAAVALTAALSLALPAQADAAPRNKPVSVWDWVGQFLEERIAAVWGRLEGTKQPTGTTKQGGCVDPNGCATPQTLTTPSGPNCARDEAGGCIDPNG
jgi:hypothetical protein